MPGLAGLNNERLAAMLDGYRRRAGILDVQLWPCGVESLHRKQGEGARDASNEELLGN